MSQAAIYLGAGGIAANMTLLIYWQRRFDRQAKGYIVEDKCGCGANARLCHDNDFEDFFIRCDNDCQRGPLDPTIDGAIDRWVAGERAMVRHLLLVGDECERAQCSYTPPPAKKGRAMLGVLGVIVAPFVGLEMLARRIVRRPMDADA